MPTIEERLDAVAHNLELVSQMQLRTEQIVNLLAEDQARTERGLAKTELGLAKTERGLAKTERILERIASMVLDHEQRLQNLE